MKPETLYKIHVANISKEVSPYECYAKVGSRWDFRGAHPTYKDAVDAIKLLDGQPMYFGADGQPTDGSDT